MTTAEAAVGAPDRPHDEIARDQRSWAQILRVWHLAFYLLVAITAGALLTSQPEHPTDGLPGLPAALAALGVLTAAYTVFGRRATNREDDCRLGGAGMAYLAVLFAVTAFVTTTNPLGTMLLFVAFSQIWLLTPNGRTGVGLSVLLTVLVTAALLFQLRGTGANPLVISFQLGLGLVFSLLMGLWLRSIITQGTERVRLLSELHAARDELGRTQHAAGVVAERERMSREIHDTLAQGFTSVVMLAQTASADLERGSAQALAGRLALIEATARDNLAEARSLVAALSPAPLHEATLGQALGRLAESFTAETGVVLGTDVDDGAIVRAGLASGAEVVLLRAAQEALSNVRRHARASTAGLSLRLTPTAAMLTVHDDGVGLGADLTEGFGLRGMRERVNAYGGTVTLTSKDPGTVVTVVVPVRALAPAGEPA